MGDLVEKHPLLFAIVKQVLQVSDLIAVSELELRDGEDVVSERSTGIVAIGSGPSKIEVPVDHLPLVSLRVVEEEIIFAGVDVVVVHPGGAGAEVIVAVQVEMIVPQNSMYREYGKVGENECPLKHEIILQSNTLR